MLMLYEELNSSHPWFLCVVSFLLLDLPPKETIFHLAYCLLVLLMCLKEQIMLHFDYFY